MRHSILGYATMVSVGDLTDSQPWPNDEPTAPSTIGALHVAGGLLRPRAGSPDVEPIGPLGCTSIATATLSKPIEVERVIIVDGATRGTRAGILIAQALNHANHHREQVCAILTGFGIEPPDIQAWQYAWHTERIWDLPKPG
jgi:hypothetical protein